MKSTRFLSGVLILLVEGSKVWKDTFGTLTIEYSLRQLIRDERHLIGYLASCVHVIQKYSLSLSMRDMPFAG
jgi:hypothetical protein